MIGQLRETCRRLLEEGSVQVVIGYTEPKPEGPVYPVFITRPEDVDRLVWNSRCLPNLTVYLKRKEVKALGNAALLVKGCDERALAVLEGESQVDRRKLYIIGLACDGVGAAKCAACEVRTPRFADEVIGVTNSGVPANGALLPPVLPETAAERWEWWKSELSRCTKCYACRQVCPLCYCERCLVDKNRPVCIDTSPSPKGNFAWHITRAFHLAGRCVGCGECVRACPAGIRLDLLNHGLARAAEDHFGYRAGMDPAAPPLFGTFSSQDKEDFIR